MYPFEAGRVPISQFVQEAEECSHAASGAGGASSEMQQMIADWCAREGCLRRRAVALAWGAGRQGDKGPGQGLAESAGNNQVYRKEAGSEEPAVRAIFERLPFGEQGSPSRNRDVVAEAAESEEEARQTEAESSSPEEEEHPAVLARGYTRNIDNPDFWGDHGKTLGTLLEQEVSDRWMGSLASATHDTEFQEIMRK